VSSVPSTSQLLGKLEQLRAAIRDLQARGRQLDADGRKLKAATEARHQSQLKGLEQEAAAAVAAAREEFEGAKARLEERVAARGRWIERAHANARRAMQEGIGHQQGKATYALQKGTLDTERWREGALARNDTALSAYQSSLGENREAVAELDAQGAKLGRGFFGFRKKLSPELALTPEEQALDEQTMLARMVGLRAEAQQGLAGWRGVILAKIFRAVPLWVWGVLAAGCALGFAPIMKALGQTGWTKENGYAAGGILLGAALALYFIARQQAAPRAARTGEALGRAKILEQAAQQKAAAHHAAEIQRIKAESRGRIDQLNAEWREKTEAAGASRDFWPAEMDRKRERAAASHRAAHDARSVALGSRWVEEQRQLAQAGAEAKRQASEQHQARLREIDAKHEGDWRQLERDWSAAIDPAAQWLQEAAGAAAVEFPDWSAVTAANWTAPRSFGEAAKFGRLEVDLARYAGIEQPSARLKLPAVAAPLVLRFPEEGSLLIESDGGPKAPALAALNQIIFRLLAHFPAGKLSFTIFDPVGLGESFAGITHLADYEENLINGRIWTQPDQLEARLADLNEHMEKVIQMYLRSEYATIADYNRAAGTIAEKYHFVVLADFPANLTDSAARRLHRIAASGARCGVHTLIHWDRKIGAPPDFLLDELRKGSLHLRQSGSLFALANPAGNPARLVLDAPPEADRGRKFLERVGEASRGANRVEVPFRQIAPQPEEIWSLSTAEELRVPVGRSGANKWQYLELGRGTRQHVLIAGKTGSGKSTLFHVIITNLALWCSPDEVEFYLVDFKKGVEFKSYAARELPHARVVAIESDREFGLSVLQRVDEELRRRGDLFRAQGVQDLAGFRRASPGVPMPRSLLIIDEFQEFFTEDDRVAQSAGVLLDRIVRQGRAFGIHALLGSQTLGGAFTLARATLGQMAVRIALQSNEADAHLIMDENNAAPRLLSRPGEGIYNDMAGAIEGNSPFQVVWLPESERDTVLRELRHRADAWRSTPEALPSTRMVPVVFEGNAPAEVQANVPLRELLQNPPAQPPSEARTWLGAPNSIKGPTEAVFRRRSGSNLLIVGQREEAIQAMFAISLAALGAQHPRGTVRFAVLDPSPAGSPERAALELAARGLPHEITWAGADVSPAIARLADELARRLERPDSSAPRVFLLIHGLQQFRKLRPEDEYSFSSDASAASPAAQLSKLIMEGPPHGLHVIASVDTYNNVNRFLGRKGLSEFGLRVLFQMSPNDSASLCDDPRAAHLGLHRALLYDEPEGRMETFRPYARPADFLSVPA